MLDFISIGDTTLDVFLTLKNARVYCDINEKACQLSLNFADKIPVSQVTNIPAVGTAPNVAVGVSRMGMKAGLYTILGNDTIGKEMFDVLRNENIVMDYVLIDQKRPSDYSVVLVFEGERTILVYHEKRIYSMPKLESTPWLFLGAIGQNPTTVHAKVVRHIRQTQARLVFNPGPVQIEQGRKKLQALLDRTHILFVNKEEAKRLVGGKAFGLSIDRLLLALQKCGPDIVVITDGKNGSYCCDGDSSFFLKAYAKKVVEATGSGDAYATGFISALHSGKEISEAMAWGTFNASSVLQHVGAQKGLLSKRKIQNQVMANPRFRAKKM